LSPRVELFHWNPRKSLVKGRLAPYTPLPSRLNNFGDLLGPLVIAHVRDRLGLSTVRPRRAARLMSVGSVLHFAQSGDVVWGSGVNGKMPDDLHRYAHLDVRAVRGPLTRDFLLARDIDVPEVYGDPALLLPYLLPELPEWTATKRHEVTIVPNFNDLTHYSPDDEKVLDPRRPLMQCLRRIAESSMVVGSSLHGVVIAEALGIPARLIEPRAESSFKYTDYYRGTGRDGYEAAGSADAAIAAGGEPGLEFSPVPLVRAFPADLWGLDDEIDVAAVLGDSDVARPI
jgi:pyruvyltransferase